MSALYKNVWVEGRSVMAHRLRAERAYGGLLPEKAVVHHADGSTHPDAPLVICPDQGYHKLLHVRMRVKAAGGNPNTERICSTCKQLKPMSNFWRLRESTAPKGPCKPCDNAHRKLNEWKARRRKGLPMKRRGLSAAFMKATGR